MNINNDNPLNELIESSRLPGVMQAFNAVFDHSSVRQLTMMTQGGSSAHMFKFHVNHHHYILRLMGLDQVEKDRKIQIDCAYYAADLNLAPKIYYANEQTGIIIMDFIQGAPLTKPIILNKMPNLLYRLHYSGKMPQPYFAIFPYMSDLISQCLLKTSSIQIIDYLKMIQELMSLLKPYQTFASCHNDLNNENILFDGQEIYLIDFEAAGWEDPYFDLATICQQNCLNQIEEKEFLKNYLGKAPQDFDVAKLILMKQISYCYHVLHFLLHAYEAGITEWNKEIPTFEQWHQDRLKGKYPFNETQNLMLYAMVALNQSQREMRQPAFTEAKKHFF